MIKKQSFYWGQPCFFVSFFFKMLGKTLYQIEKPDDLQSIENLIRFFLVCRTSAFHDGNKPKEFGEKFD